MGSFKVNIMVSQILTKNSFKSGNGLVISPLLRDFLNLFGTIIYTLLTLGNALTTKKRPKFDIPNLKSEIKNPAKAEI